MRNAELDALLAPLKNPAVADLLGEADFELGAEPGLLGHLGKVVPRGSLIPIGQHGSGSLIVLWRRDPGARLSQCPVIWIDSEGDPIEACAPDFAGFLKLLPFGLGQIYDLVKQAQRMRDGDDGEGDAIEVDVDDARAGLAMIADELDEWRAAGLPPSRDPLAIVEAAVASGFEAWFDALPDA